MQDSELSPGLGEKINNYLQETASFNLCHMLVGSIWDAQTPHAMSMAPFLGGEKQEDSMKWTD